MRANKQSMSQIPESITAFAGELAENLKAEAVVLGGSRAVGSAHTQSDWDLGVYYRGGVDLSTLAARGEIHPPGSWGRIMNGGAWLTVDGHRVDVLLRDLDTVKFWTRQAEEGRFEVDSLLGYVAGIPTYTLTAELSSCQIIHGDLPRVAYPTKLVEAGTRIWRFCRNFSLNYARKHAARGNIAGVIGNTARAVMEESHAIMCERREWVCNEKRIIDDAGLSKLQGIFSLLPDESKGMLSWIDHVAARFEDASR